MRNLFSSFSGLGESKYIYSREEVNDCAAIPLYLRLCGAKSPSKIWDVFWPNLSISVDIPFHPPATCGSVKSVCSGKSPSLISKSTVSMGHWYHSYVTDYQRLITSWLVVWNMAFIFPYIGNVIIPIDFHILQRVETTNQYIYIYRCVCIYMLMFH